MSAGKSKTFMVWLGLLAAAFLVFYLITPGDKSEPVPISDVIDQVEQGKVKEVAFSGPEVKIAYRDGTSAKSYSTDREPVIAALRAHKVKYSETPPPDDNNSWLYLLIKLVVPVILIFFLFRMLANRQGGQAQAFTSNKAVKHEHSNTKFADVAGCDEAVDEVRDLVDFLKRPKDFAGLGARIPKGVLLSGPPGTGKTLLARAVAGEAGVPFFSISGSEFVEMFVGVGAGRVRALFEEARKHAPCIVFIDEIDGVGRHRGGGNGNSHDEREQTLNQILKEMDGFEGNSGIIVLAATNRPDILDAAMMRAGRFDRKVVLPLPDVRGREAILQVHAKSKALEPDVELTRIAQDTIGMSGADLEQLLNEAALAAAKRGSAAISQADVQLAADKVLFGAERKSAVVTPEYKRLIAAHEAGHAVVGWYLPQHDLPRKVSIVPRGRAAGVTIFRPERDKYIQTRSELMARLISALGGRVAEELTQPAIDGQPDVTVGASGDLAHATHLAHAMITQLGLGGDRLLRTYGSGNLNSIFEYGPTALTRDFSEKSAEEIDESVRNILTEAAGKARSILEAHRDEFDALIAALVERETLEIDDLRKILGDRVAER